MEAMVNSDLKTLRETNDDEFKWHPMLAGSPSETDDELQSKSKGNLQTIKDFWKKIIRIDSS